MSTLAPIPMSVLKDDVLLESYIDDNGVISYKPAELISNVRVQQDVKMVYQNETNTKVIDNILFVDVQNSDYIDINDFVVNSRIFFDNEEYTIILVEKLDGYNSLHHLEITLK